MFGVIEALRHAREERGWSQKQLAEQMRWRQGHVSRIETGQTDPRLSSLIEMARLMDLEPVLVPQRLSGLCRGQP